MTEGFDLGRFLDAQAHIIESVYAELEQVPTILNRCAEGILRRGQEKGEARSGAYVQAIRRTRAAKAPGPEGLRGGGPPLRCAARPMAKHRSSRRAWRAASPARNADGSIWSELALKAGKKRSHWMWFVFPQIRGLGHSAMSERYAIASRAEARDYLAHPILGPRLVECTRLVLAVEDRSIEDIFGFPDNLKFRSCMTLFASVAGAGSVFDAALEKYFGGERDPRTVELLG